MLSRRVPLNSALRKRCFGFEQVFFTGTPLSSIHRLTPAGSLRARCSSWQRACNPRCCSTKLEFWPDQHSESPASSPRPNPRMARRSNSGPARPTSPETAKWARQTRRAVGSGSVTWRGHSVAHEFRVLVVWSGSVHAKLRIFLAISHALWHGASRRKPNSQ